MNFVEAVSILIPCVFTSAMADCLVLIPPLRQTTVDIVFVSKYKASRGDGRSDQWLNRLLLHVLQHSDDDFSPSLDHAEDGWLFLRQCPSASCTFETVSSTFAAQAFDDFRIALMAGNDIDLIAFNLFAQSSKGSFEAVPFA